FASEVLGEAGPSAAVLTYPVLSVSRDGAAAAPGQATHIEIRYEADPNFRHWVVYNADGRSGFICPEPYTWITNAPNLAFPASLTGFQELGPGETKVFATSITVKHAHDEVASSCGETGPEAGTPAPHRRTVGATPAQHRRNTGATPAQHRRNVGATPAQHRRNTGATPAQRRRSIGGGSAERWRIGGGTFAKRRRNIGKGSAERRRNIE